MKSKYLNLVLTVITIALMSIIFHLIHLQALLTAFNHNTQTIIDTNKAIVHSNQRLESEILEFSKQVEEIRNKYLEKSNKGGGDAK